jgi:hypothetical protein
MFPLFPLFPPFLSIDRAKRLARPAECGLIATIQRKICALILGAVLTWC